MDFRFENLLIGAVNQTKNADNDKYTFSDYGNVFDALGRFLLSKGKWFSKNVIIFDGTMSSSVHIDNKKEDILIPVKTQPTIYMILF